VLGVFTKHGGGNTVLREVNGTIGKTQARRWAWNFEVHKWEDQVRRKTSIEVFSKGKSAIEEALWLVHLGDWVSVYLAELRNVDPVEIKVIDFLKGELAKV